jgi:ribosomal protein S18 acetylase RimI-like enzyme
MLVRKFEPSDVAAVHTLICQLWEKNKIPFDGFRDNILNTFLPSAHHNLFVAAEAGAVIGFVDLEIVDEQNLRHGTRKCAYIHSFVVDKAHRGAGVGTKMLDYITNFARAGGVRQLLLYSALDRKRAHGFYKKNGFEKTSYRFKKDIL